MLNQSGGQDDGSKHVVFINCKYKVLGSTKSSHLNDATANTFSLRTHQQV